MHTNIKAARKHVGMSQKEVAIMLKVSAPTVSEWESGKTKPTADNLKKLSDLYDVSIDYLLGYTNKQERKEQVSSDGMETFPMIRNRLKELRERENLSQSELADIIHVHQTAVSQWETGRTYPDVHTMQSLSDYFHVSIDYIIGRTDSEESMSQERNELALVFGSRLKALRQNHGITQEQLAKLIGVERSSIGKYEGKERIIPSDEIKIRIADYFNVSIDYLLGRTDDMEQKAQSIQEDEEVILVLRLRLKELMEREKLSLSSLAKKSGG